MQPREDTARPRFFVEPIKNNSLSEEAGRPIFEDKEMIEIRIPGDKHLTWVGRVEEEHKARFPDQYAAFKRGEVRAAVGTPLEHWPPLTRARVAELKAAGLLTVEEYAGVPDSILGKLGHGSREEREKARAFIEAAKGNAKTDAMAAEIAQLKAAIEQLTGGVKTPETTAEKSIEDCTDAELKEFIKRETGEGVRGNPSRDTLLKRVAELAETRAA